MVRARLDPEEAEPAPDRATGEERLWTAALLLAIDDALGPAGKRGAYARRPEAFVEMRQARAWLAGSSASLALALMACNVDLDYWRDTAVQELRRRWAEADELLKRQQAGEQVRAARYRHRLAA